LDSVFILEVSCPDCGFARPLTCGILPQNIQWCDTGMGEPKYWEENLFHCHSIHHKFDMVWPGIEARSLWFEAGDWPPVTCHSLQSIKQYRIQTILCQILSISVQ